MRDVTVFEIQAAHFEARLIPVGDDKLKVEWLRNGIPIQACEYILYNYSRYKLNNNYNNFS